MRISDWSSDVCSSDLLLQPDEVPEPHGAVPAGRGGKAPVRRHGNAGHLARVAGEDVLQASAALEVPEPHRAVVAGRNRVAAAVDQRHGVHRALVVVEHLRSEEHTSELQSLMRIPYAAFCLKKKKT